MTPMTISVDDIRLLVAEELAREDLPVSRDRLVDLLVSPEPMDLVWDYGAPGEKYQVWVVAGSSDRAIAFVYCPQGFGPECPWGMVFPEDGNIGMDSQWHSGLADAVICAG